MQAGTGVQAGIGVLGRRCPLSTVEFVALTNVAEVLPHSPLSHLQDRLQPHAPAPTNTCVLSPHPQACPLEHPWVLVALQGSLQAVTGGVQNDHLEVLSPCGCGQTEG